MTAALIAVSVIVAGFSLAAFALGCLYTEVRAMYRCDKAGQRYRRHIDRLQSQLADCKEASE